jgi:hypothetical protein
MRYFSYLFDRAVSTKIDPYVLNVSNMSEVNLLAFHLVRMLVMVHSFS